LAIIIIFIFSNGCDDGDGFGVFGFASRFAHNTDSTSTSTSYAVRRQIHTVNHAHARLHATVCPIVHSHTRTHKDGGDATIVPLKKVVQSGGS